MVRSVYEETKNHVGTDSELRSYKINEMYIIYIQLFRAHIRAQVNKYSRKRQLQVF